MKYLKLRTHRVFPVTFYRCLSTDMFKKEINPQKLKELEEYWRKQFKYDDHFDSSKLKDKYYVLAMFPYPSGNLHMGHVRVYTISDCIARFQRMNGKNVLHPMGWDAFGLPAENAAFERGVHPAEWTKKNIASMKEQLKQLWCTFDWKHELSTCDPQYYRWTQYIFLKMYDAGLVYQKKALVNWDPVDETVLADEQVDEKGRSWRSGAKVEKRVLKQWFIRTTKFAKKLRDGLSDLNLENWRDIATIQRNWIDKCNGYTFDLKIDTSEISDSSFVSVWVENPLSLLKAEFVAVKPRSFADVLDGGDYGTERKLQIKAVNPFTNRSLPIYVTENVEYPFGRDIYLGVPSDVDADREFAKSVGQQLLTSFETEEPYDVEKICAMAQETGIGGYEIGSRLQDWLISRQRFWGTPIPVIHCPRCGVQPVPYEKLPVTLPEVPENHPVGRGLHQLLNDADWKKTTCHKCGGEASKESDTMDTFVDSTWYYLRYPEPNNKDEPFNRDIVNQMTPVDIYVGGKEHACLHLYYARFVSYFLHSIGLVKNPEPFKNLLCQGMVKGRTYKDKTGRYYEPAQVEIQGKTVVAKETGIKLTESWEKMSKSKHNGVDPGAVIEEYGIDTTRLFLLFSIAPTSHRNWNSDLFPNVLTWQRKMWLTIKDFIHIRSNPLPDRQHIDASDHEKHEETLLEARQMHVKDINYNMRYTQQIAAVIASLSALLHPLRSSPVTVRKYSKEYEKCLAAYIIMLAPIAPHFAATLWYGFTAAPDRVNTDCEEIKWNENVLNQKWPQADPNTRVPFDIIVNKGGKHKLYLTVRKLREMTEKDAITYARMHPLVQKIVCLDDLLHVKFTKMEDYCGRLELTVDNHRYQEREDSSDEETEFDKRSNQ